MKVFLVEIVFRKGLKPTPPDSGVINFYEVAANNEWEAKVKAFSLFKKDLKHSPWVKKFLSQWALPDQALYSDLWVVGEAIEIEQEKK